MGWIRTIVCEEALHWEGLSPVEREPVCQTTVKSPTYFHSWTLNSHTICPSVSHQMVGCKRPPSMGDYCLEHPPVEKMVKRHRGLWLDQPKRQQKQISKIANLKNRRESAERRWSLSKQIVLQRKRYVCLAGTAWFTGTETRGNTAGPPLLLPHLILLWRL